MSGIYGKGKRGKATMLHSKVVRSRGHCARCGSQAGPFDCAHIIPRRYAALRCDPENAWCLCKACHMRCTEWASEHMALVEATIGLDRYEELRRTAQVGVKASDAFWQGWIDVLTPMLEETA